MRSTTALIFFIAISQSAGVLGSFFIGDNWYQNLEKPVFNPPGWVFAVVWIILYFFMGVAAWFIWKRRRYRNYKPAMVFFFLQLILNAAWPVIFFRAHLPGWALVELEVLWVMILITILYFWKIDRLAAWLLVPYLCWTTFAGILNAFIWYLNYPHGI